MSGITPDSLYASIKQWESTFPLPAPYVTVDVGTLDAATGTFTGLSTKVVTDPEPIEHGPHDHPTNPPPRFVGTVWQTITIDSHWRRTITTVPAPKVGLAPVQLRFSVANESGPWSVTVNGSTTTAPAGQTSLIVSIWDRALASWTIQAGSRSHGDQLRIQRPGDLVGAGAFTIPVIPVGIIYAPPVDSLKKSVGSYGVGDTVGTTTSFDFTTDSSVTVPDLDPAFTDFNDVKNGVDAVAHVLAGFPDPASAAAGKALTALSAELGTATQTQTTDNVQSDGSSLTVVETSSQTFNTNTAGGGPGAGDVFLFYKNVRVIWAYVQGQLRLFPFGHTFVATTAAQLKSDPHGLAAADQQRLLTLDPFVAGGPGAALPAGRFTVPDGGEATIEYGGGLNVDQKYAVTRDTKTTTTTKSSTTDTSSWDPGPMLKLLGMDGKKTQVVETQTNAQADDVSSTVTLDANLFAGPDDYFVVTIWYDQLFGTWAFQQNTVATSPIVAGNGAAAGAKVQLAIAGRTYVTVASATGRYVFRAASIPNGKATLKVGNQAAKSVSITGRPAGPARLPRQTHPVVGKAGPNS
jgi:hypothetical protein